MRCLHSVERCIPDPYRGAVVVVDQNPEPLRLPAWVEVVRAEPGFPGPRRHLGAVRAAAAANETDALLFLDDDIELVDWREFPRLLDAADPCGLLARANTGCVQVATRRWHRTCRLELGDTAGGILIRVSTYFEIGGYGEDYLDDLELFARALIAGRKNWRTHVVRSLHHYGAGGLKDLIGMSRRGRAHLAHSRLAERYPEFVKRDWLRWSGYRYASTRPSRIHLAFRPGAERTAPRRGVL